jgi:hypothetical protein
MPVIPKITPKPPATSIPSFGYQAPLKPDLTGNVSPIPKVQPQAPIIDTKGILQVDKADPHVQDIQKHIEYLKGSGADIGLNDTQTSYIKRYKETNPEYMDVPDVNLFTKIIQKYPEAMDKYGVPADQRSGFQKFGDSITS